MSVNHAEIPDPVEQEAAVADFFEKLDEQDDSAETLDKGTEAIEDALEPSDETEPDEDADEDSEEPEEAPEDEEDDDSDEDEPSKDEEEDIDPVEKRFRNLQSLHDRQLNDMRQQMSQLQEWAQNSYQHQLAQHQQMVAQQQAQVQQTQQANPIAHLSSASPELKAGVEQDLQRTFVAVAQYRPDLVAATIAQAREVHGHQTGDEMQLEYNNYLMQQQAAAQEAKWTELQAQQAAAQQPAQIEATMSALVEDIAVQYGDTFTDIREDFIAKASDAAPAFRQYMDGRGLEMTPDAINYFLQKCVNDVREERIMKQASKPRRARKVAPSEHVETSTNGDGSREEDMTADERAINELLEGASELSIDTSRPTR